ncbi:DUF4349 domain-containing protein [Mucilaginibacter polytrichastri]|nr:DUF4349 domain-containing protein [Mucilaginibacter polytrichastri]
MKTKKLNAMLLIGVVLFAACKGSSSRYEALNIADTVIANKDNSQSATKLIKTASMNFKVKDVEHTNEAIGNLTNKYNGMLLHHNVTSTIEQTKDFRQTDDSVKRVSSIRTVADITVKIPSAKLEDFMNDVGKLSVYVTERKLDITDKSLDYLSGRLKLKSRSQIIAQQKSGKIVVKDPSAVLYLKDDMIDEQVNNLKIDDAVNYSVLDLHCYQSNRINKEIIANDNPSAYQNSYFNRFGMALQNGVVLFEELILGIANFWLLILLGVFSWVGYRYYRHKKQKPILNNI